MENSNIKEPDKERNTQNMNAFRDLIFLLKKENIIIIFFFFMTKRDVVFNFILIPAKEEHPFLSLSILFVHTGRGI